MMNPSWQKLEEALAELNRLARETIANDAFAGQMVAIVLQAVEAEQVIYWSRGEDGQLSALAHRPPMHATDIPNSSMATVTLRSGRSSTVQGANSKTLIYLELIPAEDHINGVLEVHLRDTVANGLGESAAMFIASAAQIAGEFQRNLALRVLREIFQHREQLLAFIDKVQASLSLGELAYVIANEVRKLVGCERVIVISQLKQQAKIIAVSGIDTFDERTAALQAWQRLAKLIGTSDESFWLSETQPDLPPVVEQAIAEVRETNHAHEFGLLPIFEPIDGKKTLVAHIAVEWFSQRPGDDVKSVTTEVVHWLGSPLLRESNRAANPLTPWGDWWTRRTWHARSEQTTRWLAQIAVAFTLLIGVALIPVPFNIEAQGELVPQQQQHIFAQAEGIVSEIAKNQGIFASGESILRLENRAWQLEFDKLRGKLAIVEEELRSVEIERLQNADGSKLPNDAANLSARIEQLSAKRHELESQHRILLNRQSELNVQAPWSGTIITWDWKQQLEGRPVKRGEQLCTIANLQGAWNVEIHIPADAAYYVSAAAQESGESLSTTIRLGNDPGRKYTGRLDQLSPAIEHAENMPPVLNGTVTGLSPEVNNARPGASATVSIECGTRTLAFVWLRPLWEFVREYVW